MTCRTSDGHIIERDLVENSDPGLDAARKRSRRGGRPLKITHRKELAATMRDDWSTLNEIAAAAPR